jgi:hypothetical protein
MIESRSAARRRRRKCITRISSDIVCPTNLLDNTMVLLIGLDHCDTKKIMAACENDIGFTQSLIIHPVENVDMSKEYVQQYKDNGSTFCAVVIFRSYKPKLKIYQMQQELLQKGITTINIENNSYLVTYKFTTY